MSRIVIAGLIVAVMKRIVVGSLVCPLVLAGMVTEVVAANAGRVISYDQGTDQFGFSTYDNPQVALGAPQVDTGWGMVTPFNNPWSSDDVVSIGLGGHITLEFENYATPLAGSPEIGVFSFQQFAQQGWPDGGTDGPPTMFYGACDVLVEVSYDMSSWVALNGVSPVTLNIFPANAFQDVAATIPSDYGLPYVGSITDFANKPDVQSTIDQYGASAGGTWIDISDSGLAEVGYIRFSVPASEDFSLQLEALSLANGAAGDVVPEPATMTMLGAGLAALVLRRRRRCGNR